MKQPPAQQTRTIVPGQVKMPSGYVAMALPDPILGVSGNLLAENDELEEPEDPLSGDEVVEVVEVPDEPQTKRRAIGGRPMIEAHSLREIAEQKAGTTAAASAAPAGAEQKTTASRQTKEPKAKAKPKAKEKAKAKAKAKLAEPKAAPTQASMGPPPVPVKAKARAAKRKAEADLGDALPASPAPGSPPPTTSAAALDESPSPGKKPGFRRGVKVRIMSNGDCRGLTGGLGDYDEANDRWEVSGEFGTKWIEQSSLAFFVAKRP
eukprot:g21346.t1